MPEAVYAVGDIHGQLTMLDHALAMIEADGGHNAPVVFLGDLVDRGPDSKGVIDRLMQGQAQGRPWTVLKGNHDRLFHEYLDSGETHSPFILSGVSWLHPRMGGAVTLASYGVSASEGQPDNTAARKAVPTEHLDYLRALPTSHLADDLLFVHAGIRPGVPLSDQSEDDLVWIRAPFLEFTDPHPWLVIHGHTALEAPQHHGNRVNLDSGAGYGRPLTTARIAGSSVATLTADGPRPLLP